MPNTILKRWNGSAFEELYPKTTVGQISASGTPSSSTFLRGNGEWITPAFSDLSGSATITQLPTITVAKGGTNTTSLTAGGTLYMNQSGGTVLATAAGSQNQILRSTSYNGVFYAPAWESPADDAANGALSTSSTSITTERNIAFGLVRVNNADQTRATTIYAPTAGGTANYGLFGNGTTSAPIWDRPHTTLLAGVSMTNNSYTGTAVTITNYRYILIQMFITASNTTQRNFILIDTADTKQLASATSGTTSWRMLWNDGTSSWADTVTIRRASSTTMDFLINSGVTWTARVTGFRGSS